VPRTIVLRSLGQDEETARTLSTFCGSTESVYERSSALSPNSYLPLALMQVTATTP